MFQQNENKVYYYQSMIFQHKRNKEMRSLFFTGSALIIMLGLWAFIGGKNNVNSQMVEAANELLNSLSEKEKTIATFDFDDNERLNWHFIPRERKGLMIQNMSEDKREKTYALLKTVLSENGYTTARAIMQLEAILREMENNPERRNPEKYHILIFGNPSDKEPWGWRYEGHHLSLNYTSMSGELSVTPAFMGSNPAIVKQGVNKGQEVLKAEQDLGRELVKSFNKEQQKTGVISDKIVRELLITIDDEVKLDGIKGLPYVAMDKAQKDLLLQLLDVYLGRMERSIAKKQLQAIKEAGIENLSFAWAGGKEPGDAHYYRIHGATILIEYDNTQNDNNHIHSVCRDLKNDFGKNLLKEHYEHGHQH